MRDHFALTVPSLAPKTPFEVHELIEYILSFVSSSEFTPFRLVKKKWSDALSSRFYQELEKKLHGKLICISPFYRFCSVDQLSVCEKFLRNVSGSVISYPSESDIPALEKRVTHFMEKYKTQKAGAVCYCFNALHIRNNWSMATYICFALFFSFFGGLVMIGVGAGFRSDTQQKLFLSGIFTSLFSAVAMLISFVWGFFINNGSPRIHICDPMCCCDINHVDVEKPSIYVGKNTLFKLAETLCCSPDDGQLQLPKHDNWVSGTWSQSEPAL